MELFFDIVLKGEVKKKSGNGQPDGFFRCLKTAQKAVFKHQKKPARPKKKS